MGRAEPYLIVIGILAASCTVPESPSAPSFDIDIDIPIANERVTMRQVVEDRPDYLGILDGAVSIKIQQDVDRFTLTERLALVPSEASIALPAPPQGTAISGDLSAPLPSELQIRTADIASGSLSLEIQIG